MIPPPHPKRKLVGCKPPQERFSYYVVSDGMVIGIKPAVVKVYRPQNRDDSLASTHGRAKVYSYQTQNMLQVLNQGEQESVKGDDIAQ